MAEYRCPKHDRIFETLTDSRKPGALAAGKFAAHPVNGHPDCPLCIEDAKSGARKNETIQVGKTNVGNTGEGTIPARPSNRSSNRPAA